MWSVLVAIILLPLVAAAIMGGVSVRAAQQDAERASQAQQLVASVQLIDAARRAADAEVLPTMLLGVLADESYAVRLGFPKDRRHLLRVTEPEVVRERRAATDRALAAVLAAPLKGELRGLVLEARQALQTARSAADSGGPALEAVSSAYSRTSATLAAGQRWATAQAVASGLGTRSVQALQDLTQVVHLSEAASRQLGELFASRVLPGALGEGAERSWIAAWGTFNEMAGQGNDLALTHVRDSYQVFQDAAQVSAFSDLLARQALDPTTQVVRTGALPGLVDRSTKRDEALAIVLQDAVAEVSASARTDRQDAETRQRTVLTLGLASVLFSLLAAGIGARWLTSSMRSLAGGAQQVSRGHLVDVRQRGPRELRTAARALSAAVAGLRRVQEQAEAVAAGDPEAALRQRPLPGPLGEVVHASVEQIVETFRAREALQAELAHQASHDALTGLANRAEVLQQLSRLLQLPDPGTGVLFIDLDGFKAVNDTHGHATGDRVWSTWRTGWRRRCGPRTWSAGSAATSSSCCCRTPATRRPWSSWGSG